MITILLWRNGFPVLFFGQGILFFNISEKSDKKVILDLFFSFLCGMIIHADVLKYGSMVKWLRHRPFTAVTGVQIPLESYTLWDTDWGI